MGKGGVHWRAALIQNTVQAPPDSTSIESPAGVWDQMDAKENSLRTGSGGAEGEDPSYSRGKSTRSDWLELAIESLIEDGIDHVKIQVLAKKLGVSRSSFYWFFDSLEHLHNELLAYWLQRNTGPIIERAMRPTPSITRAICNVFECWVDHALFDPSLDSAVRYWGRRDPKVRAIVDQADAQRVDALSKMFFRYDYAEEEALTRARVLYFTQIGHYTLGMTDALETRLYHLRSYILTFTGREPAVEDMEAFKRHALK
jgi:AcrR family transcriptional regulator